MNKKNHDCAKKKQNKNTGAAQTRHAAKSDVKKKIILNVGAPKNNTRLDAPHAQPHEPQVRHVAKLRRPGAIVNE